MGSLLCSKYLWDERRRRRRIEEIEEEARHDRRPRVSGMVWHLAFSCVFPSLSFLPRLPFPSPFSVSASISLSSPLSFPCLLNMSRDFNNCSLRNHKLVIAMASPIKWHILSAYERSNFVVYSFHYWCVAVLTIPSQYPCTDCLCRSVLIPQMLSSERLRD